MFGVLQLAGAKVTILFYLARVLKSFLKNKFFLLLSILIPVFQGTLSVLRGANVTSTFESHKLFLTFFENKFSLGFFQFVSISKNLCVIAGAKVVRLFSYTRPFAIFFESIF